jgi:hypothetical protein
MKKNIKGIKGPIRKYLKPVNDLIKGQFSFNKTKIITLILDKNPVLVPN